MGSRVTHDTCPVCGTVTWWEKKPGHLADEKRCPAGHVWHYELAVTPRPGEVEQVQVRGHGPT